MDNDLDADDQAMAQALGFSSFGAQDRPQKKRKYNPHADASGLVSQTRAPPQATTGSNSTPLGDSTRLRAPQPGSNADEIALDDDEEGNGMSHTTNNEGAEVIIDTPGDESGYGASLQSHGLPARPPPTESVPFNHDDKGHQGQAARRQPWYEGYYDPSSNQNPWKRLEASSGLQPRGKWL